MREVLDAAILEEVVWLSHVLCDAVDKFIAATMGANFTD